MSADPVAIVGLACLLPGAPDAERYWANVRDGLDCITDVPPGRWEDVFYDPGSDATDRLYCRRGGFVDEHASFDPLRFGIPPATAAGAEPDQLLALQVAADALADAGYGDGGFARERASVILGRGGYIGAGVGRLEQQVRTAEQLVASLRDLLPELDEERLASVKRDFQARLGTYGPDTAIGLVPNLAASRIANRLDLHGAAYTVDAACASSLVAVDHGCRELAGGHADLVLAGGVHVAQDVSFWNVFCRLGALSRTERIRPFDRRADGLLIGEGLGVVVLKRLSDAERDGDRVYAVIRGTGVASDGRGASVMNPSVEGQLLALERAWEAAALDPRSVGLVEAHGTATPAGDAAELATLRRFFGPPNGRRAGLGSVKSQIGHTMPAAGVAALIKAALAVHHRVLPPSLHCEEPHEALAETRFRVLGEAEPWDAEVARAGVNAFGFGGINAHVVLEAHGRRRPARPALRASAPADEPPPLVLASSTREGLLARLDEPHGPPGDGPWRVAVADPTPERVERARQTVERGTARRGRDGIWFTPSGLVHEGGRVAFLFPGVESAFEPRVEDVAHGLGLELPVAAGADELEERGHAVFAVDRLLDQAVRRLGVRPDLIAGHSLGEWAAMLSAGVVSDADADALLETLEPGALEIPGVVFAALGCGVQRAAEALAGLPDTLVSHDNCPHQTVVSGPREQVAEALARLRRGGVVGEVLAFPRGGFHSPLFAGYLDPFRASLARVPLAAPQVELWSATTCAPYPSEPEAIRALTLRHLVEPVRFRELLLALHDAGARVFVQVGTGNLVGFADDALRGRPHHALPLNVPQRSGLAQLRRVAAALWVEGVPVRLDAAGVGEARASRAPVALPLGVPLVRLDRLLDGVGAAAAPAGDAADPVVREFAAAARELRAAEEEVLRALRRREASRAPRPLDEQLPVSVAAYPELADHSFFRQPDGWPDLADRGPVVPLTMSVELLRAAASRAAGGRVAVALENVRAHRWLAAHPPVEVPVRVRPLGADRVHAELVGYAEADVVLADGFPTAPPPAEQAPAGERPPPFDAAGLYAGRWMFHGPAYQAVSGIDAWGDRSLRGRLRALPASGALLDGAGQLFGLWIMLAHERDRMAMPVRIERLELFGDAPGPEAEVRCAVAVRSVTRHDVTADLELTLGGRVLARITGWRDWRFDTDERFWQTIQFPDREIFGELDPAGFVLVRDDGRSDWAWEYLERRYLSAPEREGLGDGPRRRRRLLGRIAAKDAVRRLAWQRGAGPLYPVEVEIRSDEAGKPEVRMPGGDAVHVTIAHTDGVAVALAAVGAAPGIDIEVVTPRGPGFAGLAFSPAEQALVPAGAEREEWLTRLWCAKEAAGKARGTGLAGSPRALTVEAVDGERVRVDGAWVRTRRDGDAVVAWTEGGHGHG